MVKPFNVQEPAVKPYLSFNLFVVVLSYPKMFITENSMKKSAIAILVVLFALVLCSCATKAVSYPRVYTITENSLDAIIKDSVSKVPANTVAAFGGQDALEKAIRKQIPEGFLKIALNNESSAVMTVVLEESTSTVEGTVSNGVVTFEIEGVKDSYTISKDWSEITGNWYGVDVKLVCNER